jgi:hypothetical protein
MGQCVLDGLLELHGVETDGGGRCCLPLPARWEVRCGLLGNERRRKCDDKKKRRSA